MVEDTTKPKDSGATETKPKGTRERKFPIRNFSKLLDEFIGEHPVTDESSVADLIEEVDAALLHYYKK